jgi:hypothetical protein
LATHNYYSEIKKDRIAGFNISASTINISSPAEVKKENPPKVSLPEKETKKENEDKTVLSAAAKPKENTGFAFQFDDVKPGAPDKLKDLSNNRFPDRGRDIYMPTMKFNGNGKVELVNPLPAGGIEKNKDGPGFTLLNPKLTAEDNFAAFDAPAQTVAALFDELSNKFPNVEKNVLYRLAKVGTFVAIDVPLMVASHEMGHAGAAVASCPACSPNVNLTNWMSGYTSYNAPKGTSLTDKQELFMSVAGMNQATYNGEEVDRRMHTKGADIADAIEYLVNITNSANYQVKDWIKNSPPGYNDGATYHAAMEARGKGWNQQNLSMLAVGVNLLNADFWASLIGSVNYIATGKQVKLPELKIGDVHVSAPNFSLINTTEGPQLNTSIYGHMDTKTTLEVKYSTILTPDNGPSMGLETRLHNLDIPGTKESLSISPRVGISTSNGDIGFKIGTGIEFRPGNNEHMAITAGIDYRRNYMPDAQLPGNGADGLQGTVGLKFNF